jgi:hypothetical protein
MDYTEEEAQRMLLQNKLDKANERIEELEDTIRWVKEVVKRDLLTNNRCLKEENVSAPVEILINTWIKFDKNLLQLLKGANK